MQRCSWGYCMEEEKVGGKKLSQQMKPGSERVFLFCFVFKIQKHVSSAHQECLHLIQDVPGNRKLQLNFDFFLFYKIVVLTFSPQCNFSFNSNKKKMWKRQAS